MVVSPTGDESGLVGYWNFNEGEGNSLTDLSGNGNNGIIYGATWVGNAAPLANPDLEVLTLNIQTELETGGCNKHYYTPETDIGIQQNKIEEIYVSYESSNSVDCGGFCGSTHLNLEILDEDGNVEAAGNVQVKGYVSSEYKVQTQYEVTLYEWDVYVDGRANMMAWDMYLNLGARDDQSAYHEYFLAIQVEEGQPFMLDELNFVSTEMYLIFGTFRGEVSCDGIGSEVFFSNFDE